VPAAAPSILGSTGSTTVVLAALLVLLGLVMLGAAAWLVRATRTDSRALGPLEVMGDRRFARRDPEARAAALAGARPEGAVGPHPMLEIDEEPEPSAADEDEPAGAAPRAN
jgi:hypothetical protein